MAVYIVYLFFLLSVIAFSPTRYFSYSYIALISSLPGVVYCLFKYPSKILILILLLLLLTVYSGWDNNLLLYDFGRRISSIEIITSASIWLISFVIMKLSLENKVLNRLRFHEFFFYNLFYTWYISNGERNLRWWKIHGTRFKFSLLCTSSIALFDVFFPKN